MSDSPNFLPTEAEMLAMYEQMLVIRKSEEQLAKDVLAGRTPGQVHLSDGQEAVAVGVCQHLSHKDQITSTHRGHGHFIAKGGDPKKMFAEIYGKAEGICGGMGGSMHVADFSIGIVGANGIVGAGFAIATGAAFANQLDKSDRIAVCFFGDGASNQGVLMECLNISSLWNLPLLFICENNGYSEFSPAHTLTSGVIADRAKPFGIPTHQIDGNNLIEVWRTASEAIEYIRAGNGPVFIEAKTYRYSGHFGSEALVLDKPYRPEAEIADWRANRDPIDHFRTRLQEQSNVDAKTLDAIETRVEELIAQSVAFAEAGTEPLPGSAKQLMFSSEPG